MNQIDKENEVLKLLDSGVGVPLTGLSLSDNPCLEVSGVKTVDSDYGLIQACCEQCGIFAPVEYREFKDFDRSYEIWLCENC